MNLTESCCECKDRWIEETSNGECQVLRQEGVMRRTREEGEGGLKGREMKERKREKGGEVQGVGREGEKARIGKSRIWAESAGVPSRSVPNVQLRTSRTRRRPSTASLFSPPLSTPRSPSATILTAAMMSQSLRASVSLSFPFGLPFFMSPRWGD